MSDIIPDCLKQDYYTKPFINIYKYLNSEDLAILTKLNINIENKEYTQYQFSLINAKLIKLRKSHDLLKEKNINSTNYIKLLHLFSKIEEDYKL